jgi:ATPase subunit of ABC transporter with duplicated ATPase domains
LSRLVVSGANCLPLDEPTTRISHLASKFDTALEAFPGTVLVSVHDRAFIERFASTKWRIRDEVVRKEYLRLK